jgi:voltage-gated sodium channel
MTPTVTIRSGDAGSPERLRATLRAAIEAPCVQRFLFGVILVNAATLGLETSDRLMATAGGWLRNLDRIAISIFVVEIAVKIFVYGPGFFRRGWNVFDFVVVGIALVPSTGFLSVLRSLRILRALRMFSLVPRLRTVVGALFDAIPGMTSIAAVLAVVFYVASVISTKLFGDAFDGWFGTVGRSMYSLFQVMTLESWSMGIVRPVMEVYPWAWAFFVPFIVATSFTVLNLFIAILVSAIQTQHGRERQAEMEVLRTVTQEEASSVAAEITELRRELGEIRRILESNRTAPSDRCEPPPTTLGSVPSRSRATGPGRGA